MSFSYRGNLIDKRGCYVILPTSPFGRFDFNDNTAEAEDEIEVLEGPEVEIVGFGSCESSEDESEDFGARKAKVESPAMDGGHIPPQGSGPILPHAGARAEPDNRYYEVEAILAGPKKRREHLFKVCYKVRWKGYGPEADTWQPIADLANVQDMIEEFKKEKAVEARKKRKNEPRKGEGKSQSSTTPVENQSDSDDDSDQYDPEYGTVKDKFWKDLELGRHQNHAQLFSGDMYSKVKGCRRAAHAEAVANIQKQNQQLHGKTPQAPDQPEKSTPRSSKLRQKGRLSKSTPTLSSKSASSRSSFTPKSKFSPVGRARKRSSDPFSARGYMSAKRSRRSREMRSGSQSDEKRSASVSSVTSETMGIVTTSSPVTPPALPNPSIVLSLSAANSQCGSVPVSATSTATTSKEISTESSKKTAESDTEEDMDEVFPQSSSSPMKVSSETMLTVTTETIRLDPNEDVIRPEEIFTLRTDDNFLIAPPAAAPPSSAAAPPPPAAAPPPPVAAPPPPGASAGASSNDGAGNLSHDAHGATSSGSLPGSSKLDTDSSDKRSTLDAQSEASGAVERSHDEDCLWNGACNRSDCKSNRRRNMKKGQGENGNEQTENDNGEDQSAENLNPEGGSQGTVVEQGHGGEGEATSGACESRSAEKTSETISSSSSERNSFSIDRNTSSSTKEDTSSPSPQGPAPRRLVPLNSHQSSSQRRSSKDNKDAGSSKQSSSSGSYSRTSGQSRRSLFSSTQADSSDSSFDESPAGSVPLTREAVSESFDRMDALAHRMHLDTIASSTSRASSLTTSALSGVNTSTSSSGSRKSLDVERPGLFSDNNSAFKFSRQDSGFSGGSTTPGDSHGQFMLPSPTGSINLCSPGKENFSSSNPSGSLSSNIYTRLQSPMDVDVPDSRTTTLTTNPAQTMTSQSRTFVEPAEGRSARKRVNDVSQPLEKIPSPNSRDSDLDRRISTLTCDELEDFVEQGEDRYSHKDTGFVSNADLLQAVNLSKAEVVKRAISQSRHTDHKLDFEQPDNSGLTLLMRAVQKGTVAIVEMLLEYGVNVNAQQTNGTTALMLAAEQNAVCLVALLLKHGASSSLYTVSADQAETALMKAIKRQHREVVNLMLRVGVNIAAPTCTSMSALDMAIDRRNPHIEGIVRAHYQRLDQAFRSKVLSTLEATAELMEPLFPMQCFPLRESHEFVVKFNSNIHPVAPGEGFLLFIAHTKITDKGVRCRFHGGCPIGSVTLNGVVQSPLTKEVNFVTSCHPIIPGCNTLVIHKLADYTSKAKLVVQAFRAKLLPC